MEQRCGPYIFFSNFDSGNLARVEKCDTGNQGNGNGNSESDPTEKEDGPNEIKADHTFNVWASPDGAGTPFQNGNRSWFHFGIRGSLSSHTIRITVMNMNRQSKLYSQGYNVIAKFLPTRQNWERLRIKPIFRTVESSFMLTFFCTFPHGCDTAYFAFCYPWSYEESQSQLSQLDSLFSYCSVNTELDTRSSEAIYYYRETICFTLQGRKVDLITVSDFSNMLSEPEPRFDIKLFPERKERCRAFKNKRVFILTSRVHPGETPGSFVFNGFLNFILRSSDLRAKKLRQLYVFKLIPLLNPDGVYCGHYRTDSRGVNLNRVYLDPNFELYPSIYAAKALAVFHHVFNRVKSTCDTQPDEEICLKSLGETEPIGCQELSSPGVASSDLKKSASEPLCWPLPDRESNRFFRVGTVENLTEKSSKYEIGNEGSDEDDIDFTPHVASVKYAPNLCDKALLQIPPAASGLAFYVDLHGHASKRGCFFYGNHLTDETQQVDNLTYAKLVSLNSQHFDFEACNFTEKNMYTKDKHDNSSKEGAGRVAIYKAIGIVHSYTLECNYNTGRVTNSLSNATGVGSGRTTPPTPPSYMPIRYAPVHFEEVGRGVAIAALDMTQDNPCSRVPTTEFGCLNRVKEWIRYRVLAGKAESRVFKSNNAVASNYTSQRNGASKHRSLSMPNNRSPGNSKVYAKNGGIKAGNQVNHNKVIQNKPAPTSPAKRTLSFSTRNNPSTVRPNQNESVVPISSEPSAKWPSLSPEEVRPRPVSPAVRQSQQLLSISKIEPTLTIAVPPSPTRNPTFGSSSQVSPQYSNGKQSNNNSGSSNSRQGTATSHIEHLKMLSRRPSSRGFSYFSSSHNFPSSPALLSTAAQNMSKSVASSSVQRQLSADSASTRQNQQTSQPQISAMNLGLPWFSKPNDEDIGDMCQAQDSTDGITEMFGSLGDVQSDKMQWNDSGGSDNADNSIIFPPIDVKKQDSHPASVSFVIPFDTNIEGGGRSAGGGSNLTKVPKISTTNRKFGDSNYYFYNFRRRNHQKGQLRIAKAVNNRKKS